MRGSLLGAALLLVGGSALGSDLLLTFRGGIGVQAATAVDPATGLAVQNVVRGVSPGGAPWVISRLEAKIRVDGRIDVRGRGLLLAGGNGVGTNGNQHVHAVLFCGAAATASAHSTPAAGVAIDSSGDFRIEDELSPTPPSTCTTPVLLIENAQGKWFAAGILANEHGDD